MEKLKDEKILIEEFFKIEDTKWEGKNFVTNVLIFNSLTELKEFLKILIKSGT